MNKSPVSPFDFVFFKGVIESIEDELGANRVRIRAFGFHTEDKNELPVELLPLATFLTGTTGMSAPNCVPGDWCFGFFLDGMQAQMPMVIGVIPGIPEERDTTVGFSDPDGIHPKYLNVPTTPRNARGNTHVHDYKTKTAWQNPTAFGAKYPFNKVIETDKSAMFELDDTEGSERVNIFHHKGSYVEFLPDGTIVVKSVADRWDVSFKNHTMLVNGNLNIGATGSGKITFGGDAKISAGGSLALAAGGSLDLGAGGSASLVAGGEVALNGSSFDWGNAGDNTGGADSVEGPGDTSAYVPPPREEGESSEETQ